MVVKAISPLQEREEAAAAVEWPGRQRAVPLVPPAVSTLPAPPQRLGAGGTLAGMGAGTAPVEFLEMRAMVHQLHGALTELMGVRQQLAAGGGSQVHDPSPALAHIDQCIDEVQRSIARGRGEIDAHTQGVLSAGGEPGLHTAYHASLLSPGNPIRQGVPHGHLHHVHAHMGALLSPAVSVQPPQPALSVTPAPPPAPQPLAMAPTASVRASPTHVPRDELDAAIRAATAPRPLRAALTAPTPPGLAAAHTVQSNVDVRLRLVVAAPLLPPPPAALNGDHVEAVLCAADAARAAGVVLVLPQDTGITDAACATLLEGNCEVLYRNPALGFTLGKALDSLAMAASLGAAA